MGLQREVCRTELVEGSGISLEKQLPQSLGQCETGSASTVRPKCSADPESWRNYYLRVSL